MARFRTGRKQYGAPPHGKWRAAGGWGAGLLALLLTAAVGARPAGAVVYTVTDLGTLGGDQTTATSMNNSGQVVGSSTAASGSYRDHPFLYDAAGMHDLRPLLGSPFASVNAINDAGQIAGREGVGDSGDPLRPFIFDSTLHDLGGVGGGYEADASVINAQGHVAGRAADILPDGFDAPQHAVFYDGAALHDIGTLPGYQLIYPTGINASDVIVGVMTQYPPAGHSHAFIWQNGVMRELGTLGGDYSVAYGINDAGQVVGTSLSGAHPYGSHAFLYDTGEMHDLGTLGGSDCTAYSINNLGQIVGSSTLPAYVGLGPGTHAFIYREGAMRDLDLQLLPHPAWDSFKATAINDHGVILVSGQTGLGYGANTRAYLLTPVPGPLLTVNAENLMHFGQAVLDFENQPAGVASTARTLTLTNEGELPVAIDSVALTGPNGTGTPDPAFAIASDSGEPTLAPGASRILKITFTPSADGSYSAAVAIHHNDPRPAALRLVGLAGTGIVSGASVSAGSVTFDDQLVGTTSGEHTITVTDTGAAPLVLQAARLTGVNASEFTVPDLSGVTIAPGQSETVSLHFLPTARGRRGATLTLLSNAPGSPLTVTLTGQGTAPALRVSPTALHFGQQPVGLNGSLALLLENTGDAPLTVSSLAIQGPNAGDFSLAPGDENGSTLQPGDITLLNVRFLPALTGSRSATLVITDDAPDSPQAVALAGSGTAPLLALSSDALVFGVQAAGTTQTLILTNGGDAPLLIDGIGLSGPDMGHFQIRSDSGEKSLAVGASRTLTITLTAATIARRSRQARIAAAPLAAASYRATLEIRDNDPRPDAPHQVTLTALAAGAPAPSPTPPAAPTSLAATLTAGNQVALTWAVNSHNETALAIWRQSGAGAFTRVGVVVPGTTHFIDASVSPNTTYTYEVRAINNGGASPWSNRVTVLTLEAPPAAPTSLTATVAAGEVDLTWARGFGDETGISIFRRTGSGDWQRVGVVAPSATRFADRTARAETSYLYQVRAHNSHYVSAWSNEAAAVTLEAPPAAPANLTLAVVSASEIDLTWTRGFGNETGISIFRRTGASDWQRIGVVAPSRTSFADRSVQPGTSYSYQVRAHNSHYVSAWTNTVSGQTLLAP